MSYLYQQSFPCSEFIIVHYRNTDVGNRREQNKIISFLVIVLSSLVSNDSSDKTSAASLGTLFHNSIYLNVRKFARRFKEKIPLHLPSHYFYLQPPLLHYVISLTYLMSTLWYVILSLLPNQTHLATWIFPHKSRPADSLDHFCCSSLKCLQFISLFSKLECSEMSEAKTKTSCYTSYADRNRND